MDKIKRCPRCWGRVEISHHDYEHVIEYVYAEFTGFECQGCGKELWVDDFVYGINSDHVEVFNQTSEKFSILHFVRRLRNTIWGKISPCK